MFTLVLGVGAVFKNDPAWQAITPEIVSAERHAPAVALNSVGYNVARAVGPALGGLVIAAAGSGWCVSAECGFVFRRDLLSVPLEAPAL